MREQRLNDLKNKLIGIQHSIDWSVYPKWYREKVDESFFDCFMAIDDYLEKSKRVKKS